MRHLRIITLLVCCAALLLPALSGAGKQLSQAPPAPDQPTLTFGSRAVLEGCWSPEALRGTAAEKKTVARSSPRQAAAPPEVSLQNPPAPLPQALRGSIRSVSPPENLKVMALTFDLCQGQGEIAGYDGDIVDFLRKTEVKATFLAGGLWLRSHPVRAMQLMADPLFEIGNHSWSHPNFRQISPAAMRRQILATQAQYHLLREELAAQVQARGLDGAAMQTIPALPLIFRFPYGTCNNTALEVTAALGLPAVQWSIVTADAVGSQTPDKIAALILKRARPGAIVIMHANGKGVHTARALALSVPPLLDQGYQFVTVSELLQKGTIFSTDTCYEEKPGDDLRYDRPPEKTGR